MEFLISTLTIFTSLLSAGGLIFNNTFANAIKERSHAVEEIEVRVENVPTHNILKGEIDSIKLATRGWELRENFRLEVFELETDPLKFDFGRIREINADNWQEIFELPLNFGLRTVMTEDDLNRLVRSPRVQNIITQFIPSSSPAGFQIQDINFDLKSDQRIRINTIAQSQQSPGRQLNFSLEISVNLVEGNRLEISNPQGTLNGQPVSNELLQSFTDSINMQLDLRRLEPSGIIARFLQFDVTEGSIELATLIHIADR